jgi:GYF domain 2
VGRQSSWSVAGPVAASSARSDRRGGETFGPFSFERLVEGIREGELQAEDLVWSSGMPQWQAARDIAGLWSPPSLPDPSRSRPAPAALPQEQNLSG